MDLWWLGSVYFRLCHMSWAFFYSPYVFSLCAFSCFPSSSACYPVVYRQVLVSAFHADSKDISSCCFAVWESWIFSLPWLVYVFSICMWFLCLVLRVCQSLTSGLSVIQYPGSRSSFWRTFVKQLRGPVVHLLVMFYYFDMVFEHFTLSLTFLSRVFCSYMLYFALLSFSFMVHGLCQLDMFPEGFSLSYTILSRATH